MLRATAACQFSRSKLQKWLRACGVLHILTYKYASRHSGVPFLRIRTSKISAALRCFVHFDLQMCFSPQRRAIFANRNVQNGSEHAVFCTFWLTNVLLATAACHFCKSQRPKLVPHWGVLCILTYKCTSRHSGVPFLQIATSKMAPALRCFVHFDLQMCFAPQRRAIFPHRNFQNGSAPEVFCTFWHTNVLRATAACHFSYRGSAATSAPAAFTRLLFGQQEPRIIEKTQRFATLLTFGACVSAFLWLYSHGDLLSTDLTAVLLCFSTVHIVGS